MSAHKDNPAHLESMEQPAYFSAFDPGREFTDPHAGSFRCETREIGELNLPSGRIVVGDPLVDLTAPPLAQKVAPGRYPVIAAIAHLNADQRIACAMVRISDQRPVRWVLAVNEEQNVDELKAGDIYGYGVDSGMGSFASAESAAALDARMAADDEYFEEIIDAAQQVYVHTRDWASVHPDEDGDANVMVFSSGFGDGFYASWWGYDERDEPVCLVTDFGLVGFDEKEPAPAEKPGAAAKATQAENATRAEKPSLPETRPWWKVW